MAVLPNCVLVMATVVASTLVLDAVEAAAVMEAVSDASSRLPLI